MSPAPGQPASRAHSLRSTAPALLSLVLAGPAAAEDPSLSKLAPHFLIGYPPGGRQIVQAHPRVIKILDTGGAMLSAAREYKAGTPDGKVVLRIFTTRSYTRSTAPGAAAADFWSRVLAPPLDALSASDRALIDYIEGPNEGETTPTWGSIADAQWYNSFWLTLANRIADAGFRPCAFSIAVGNPPGDMTYVRQVLDTIAPALRECKARGGAWSYHAYTLRYSTDVGVEIWYSLRYRQYYEHFASKHPDLVDLPLILTEGGVDGQTSEGGPGWKAFDAARYQAWLAWFDGEMRKDAHVLGCTLFQSGETGGWSSFELEPVAPFIAGRLRDALPSGTIAVSPASLAFSAEAGTDPASRRFTVRNSGSRTLTYTISDNASWLSASPASGTSTGEEDAIDVKCAASALSEGERSAVITIRATDASNTPQRLPVTLTVEPAATRFIRGDSDGSGEIDIADGVRILTFLFLDGSGSGLPCEDAADTNDDGKIEITDAVAVLVHLFLGGDAPAQPFPLPGVDETEDDVGCETGLSPRDP